MNMPEVDTYGTVQPHTLIRQHMDYSHWYDRTKLSLKEIHNCQYVASMNPTAGSFTINPRLQRAFAVFAVSFPGLDALESIYKQILDQHLTMNKFSATVTKCVEPIIKTALLVHTKISTTFLPTAVKFHYIFNLRDLSNIFQVEYYFLRKFKINNHFLEKKIDRSLEKIRIILKKIERSLDRNRYNCEKKS